MFVEIDLFDAWSMWAYKAKIFFLHRTIPFDRFGELAAAFGHWDYPQHVPLLEAWILLVVGEWNDQLPRVIFPLHLAALCACAYGFLARRVGTGAAMAGALLFATLPGLQEWTIGTMTEPVLLCHFVAALGLLQRWMDDRDDRLLVLAGILAGLAGWTKNDGMALMLSLAVMVAVWLVAARPLPARAAVRAWLLATVPAVLVVLPWTMVKLWLGLDNDVVAAGNLASAPVAERLARVPEILGAIGGHLADVRHWNLVWPLFATALFLRARQTVRGAGKYLLVPVPVLLAIYVALYVVWPHEAEEYRENTVQRLLLGPAAVAVLFSVLALATPAVRGREG
jgi:hypothetical protein